MSRAVKRAGMRAPGRARIAVAWRARRPRAPSTAELQAALGRFLARLGYGGRGVSVLLADDRTLRALNRRWRGRDAATDVLSWSYLDLEPPHELLGELALSLPRARAQAAANGWDLRTEVLRLLAHGCAHLAGYDHRTRAQDRVMRKVEERLLAEIGVRNLYP